MPQEKENAKIEIKIGDIQIQLEGSSKFVSKQYDKIEKHLDTYVRLSQGNFNSNKTSPAEANNSKVTEEDETPVNTTGFPETFGEWLNIIPNDSSETIKALMAGYFNQLNTEETMFRVRDVSKILKQHGIKLSNTSRFVKSLVESKKIFQVSKNGSEANYRVSRTTEDELKELLM